MLCCAVLCCAVLCCPVLCCAVLCCAVLPAHLGQSACCAITAYLRGCAFMPSTVVPCDNVQAVLSAFSCVPGSIQVVADVVRLRLTLQHCMYIHQSIMFLLHIIDGRVHNLLLDGDRLPPMASIVFTTVHMTASLTRSDLYFGPVSSARCCCQ